MEATREIRYKINSAKIVFNQRKTFLATNSIATESENNFEFINCIWSIPLNGYEIVREEEKTSGL